MLHLSVRAIVLGLIVWVLPAVAVEFHVSPSGDDGNLGTAERPFATITRARDAVRAAGSGKGTTVWIHEGRYCLPDSVMFGKLDSGMAGAPVVYRAVDGENVWLSGGIPLPLSAFESVTDAALLARMDPSARKNVRRFVLSKELLARVSPEWPDTWWYYRRAVTRLTEVFAGDQRLPMARWPNEGQRLSATASPFGSIPSTDARYSKSGKERRPSARKTSPGSCGPWRSRTKSRSASSPSSWT